VIFEKYAKIALAAAGLFIYYMHDKISFITVKPDVLLQATLQYCPTILSHNIAMLLAREHLV
jgi:hypothetical protein